MNADVGMHLAGHGGLTISAEIADERVCSVRVASTRPTNLSRLFIGRPADEAPLLAERVFSLCGASHRIVAARAIASARNDTPCIDRSRAQSIVLIVDRLAATLRSNMILALHVGDALTDVGQMRALGEILSLTRDISAEAVFHAARGTVDRQKLRPLVRRICALGREHLLRGWPDDATAQHSPSFSPFQALTEEFETDDLLPLAAPDALSAADDAAILAGLRGTREAFAAAPTLRERAPETGAFARQWRRTDFSRGALAARFEARMIDLKECFERLEHTDHDDPALGSAISPAPGEGFAVAETSRGRLYHWAQLSADDRIEDYQIVAPTEWNFHPAGPFVAALLGAAVASASAERRIVQLAGLIDPCVPFRVEVRDHARA